MKLLPALAMLAITVVFSLREKNAIGVVGERCYLYDMLKNITFDLAIRQYYTDVSLFYIFEESHGEQFGWLRFLPHLQNTQLGGRNIDEVTANWEGSAQSSFIDTFNSNMYPVLKDTLPQVITGIAAQLDGAANAIEQADEEVAKAFKG